MAASFRTQLVLYLVIPLILLSLVTSFFTLRMSEGALRRDNVRLVRLVARERSRALVWKLRHQQRAARIFLDVTRVVCRRRSRLDKACIRSAVVNFIRSARSDSASVRFERTGPLEVSMDGLASRPLPFLSQGQIAAFSGEGGPHFHYFVRAEEANGRRGIILGYDATRIMRLFKEAPALNREGETYLLDPRGQLMVPEGSRLPPGEVMEAGSKPVRSCMGGHSGATITHDAAGRRVFMGFEPMGAIGGGCMIAEITRSAAYSAAYSLERKMFLGQVAFFLFLLGISYAIASGITRPVRKLIGRALMMRDGDLSSPFPAEGALEVRILGNSLSEASRALSREIENREAFMAMVSHDLRNPLAAIQLFASHIGRCARETPDPKRPSLTVEAARRIEAACSRMNRLIADILDLSRIRTGTFEISPRSGDPGPLIRETFEMLRPLAGEKGIEMTLRNDLQPCAIRIDPDRISQVLTNLISNSLKFTPAGGKIGVDLKRVRGEVEISVSDTGSGIPAGDLAQVFDRYWRSAETRRLGTGLGLFICREIVHAHGGRIWAESEKDAGSRFAFTLPIDGD